MENFKIKVTPEQSRVVQETVFKNGGEWYNRCSGVLSLDSQFLFLTDGTITHSQHDNTFNNHQNPEITFEEFERKYVKVMPPHISELPYIEMEVRNLNSEEWRVKKVICVKEQGCHAIDGIPTTITYFNQYRPIKLKRVITKRQVAEILGIDVENLTIEE